MKDSDVPGAVMDSPTDSTTTTMSSTDEVVRRRQLARFQAKIGALMLVIMIVPFVLADALSRSDDLGKWMARRQIQAAEKNNRLYVNEGTYFDTGDRLLLHDLPKADFSRGGVYVLGASTAIYCLDDYRLPPQEQRLIHNYGVYAMNYTQQFHFVRFLVERHDLLNAGGEKTMAVLGLTFTNAIERGQIIGKYFPSYFDRSGVYRYDAREGIVPVPMTAIERFTRTEYARARSFILRCWNGPTEPARKPLNVIEFRNENIERMGPDWAPALDHELAALAQTLDYLQARHVHVTGVLIPEGSWTAGIPARERFRTQVGAIFAERDLPLLDYSRLVPDSEFHDALHCAREGTVRIHEKMVRVSREFLRDTGAMH